jgi:hypothetical protein
MISAAVPARIGLTPQDQSEAVASSTQVHRGRSVRERSNHKASTSASASFAPPACGEVRHFNNKRSVANLVHRRQSRTDSANRRPARSRPGPADARDHQTACGRAIHPLQGLRASAAAGPCAQAQDAAGTLTARSGRPCTITCRLLANERRIPLTLVRNS